MLNATRSPGVLAGSGQSSEEALAALQPKRTMPKQHEQHLFAHLLEGMKMEMAHLSQQPVGVERAPTSSVHEPQGPAEGGASASDAALETQSEQLPPRAESKILDRTTSDDVAPFHGLGKGLTFVACVWLFFFVATRTYPLPQARPATSNTRMPLPRS